MIIVLIIIATLMYVIVSKIIIPKEWKEWINDNR
ncbi:hypothetical protein LCGC14_2339360 [marine sediment metagenome]|uniref:Uncharacterized protein n=1 Tax=marine sediment metagenome TaxID=412755 RepID=A0A0F9F7J2_9ZZZZ